MRNMQHILLFRWIFLPTYSFIPGSWQCLALAAQREALIEMSGILCVRPAVDYFSFGCFHCEKSFASSLTGDAFIPAGFRDASCPSSQGNRTLAPLFPHCLLETNPNFF